MEILSIKHQTTLGPFYISSLLHYHFPFPFPIFRVLSKHYFLSRLLENIPNIIIPLLRKYLLLQLENISKSFELTDVINIVIMTQIINHSLTNDITNQPSLSSLNHFSVNNAVSQVGV